MAGIEFRGLDQMKRDFDELERRIGLTVVIPAEDAAAAIFKHAIESANIPHKTGQLAGAVVVVDAMKKQMMGTPRSGRRGLYVGIEKKKGYYGYWLDKGWIAMGGAGRRKRKGTKTTHGQAGIEGGTPIPGSGWFTRAVEGAIAAAHAAYKVAFDEALSRIKGAA